MATEADVRAKLIDPAIAKSGWDDLRVRREVSFTAGRINVRGKTVSRGKQKQVDYLLYYKNNFPIALIEAKDSDHSPSDGMQQGLAYAEALDVPFVYSSNGEGFVEHNRLQTEGEKEQHFAMAAFPSPEELYARYREHKQLGEVGERAVLEDYYEGLSAHPPRYYQRVAINRAVEAVAKGQNRLLLVMATGTGKTYTAFQIIYRLWKSRQKKRILFLVDRTALADQTLRGDFRHFGDKMTKIEKRIADPAYEVYVALYQGITGGEEERQLFKQFSPDFFDLVVVDEGHRGSAKADAVWREVLDYYSYATQIGLTATPKETSEVSNEEYFGKPIYTYSLKQGIEDGFLAPYKVMRYVLDKDIEWRPNELVRDQHGNPIEDRVYNSSDYDRNIVIKHRTKLVAEKITDFLKDTDRMQKTIIFCVDIDHAERMREELVNLNADLVTKNHRYVMRITGDNEDGKNELENFIDPASPYPTLVTTSKLLTTGVDAKTCKLIVLDAPINSMTEFKQIIGRGTRIEEDYGKYYFTIMDFRGVTRLFADPEFDGDPVKVYEPKTDESVAEQIEAETVSGEALRAELPEEQVLISDDEKKEKRGKVVVSEGVEFNLASRMIQYIDPETGKLVAESLEDYSKKRITEQYRSLHEFLTAWNESARKDAIISTLEEQGVVLEELRKDVGANVDDFDLILHVAYGKKARSRSERAHQVRDRDYFDKYEGRARAVLEALLEKYADEGSRAIDDIGDLNVAPFTEFGTPVEIVEEIFGGKEAYQAALRDLQNRLYATA